MAGVTKTIADITSQITDVDTALAGTSSITFEFFRTIVETALNAVKASLTAMKAKFENYKTTLQSSRMKREAGSFNLFYLCNL